MSCAASAKLRKESDTAHQIVVQANFAMRTTLNEHGFVSHRLNPKYFFLHPSLLFVMRSLLVFCLISASHALDNGLGLTPQMGYVVTIEGDGGCHRRFDETPLYPTRLLLACFPHTAC